MKKPCVLKLGSSAFVVSTYNNRFIYIWAYFSYSIIQQKEIVYSFLNISDIISMQLQNLIFGGRIIGKIKLEQDVRRNLRPGKSLKRCIR